MQLTTVAKPQPVRLCCAPHAGKGDVRSAVQCSARVSSGQRATTQAGAPDSSAPSARAATLQNLGAGSLSFLRQGSSAACVLAVCALLCPGTAHAGELISPAALDLFESWLNYITELGPMGPVLFIATVSIFECVPLFPTQPLSLAAGLLFGISHGAAYNLTALTLAATFAFTISRVAGRDASEELIAEETKGGGSGSMIARKISEVEGKIAEGTPVQQALAIFLLRLTPIVPFSASNYVLGLTPVPYGPFIAATIPGMAPWAFVYASLGGAGRALLTSGIELDAVMAHIGEQAGDVSEKAAIGALALGMFVGLVLLIKKARSGGSDPALLDSQITDRETVNSGKE